MTDAQQKNSLRLFAQPKMVALLFLGFSSGLPLYLTKLTLQAWMTTAGVSLTAIGVFSLLNAPYSLKFAWAPLLDRFVPPYLGRRRGWILTTQILLLLAIAAMSLHDPKTGLYALGVNALAIAFLSASQDISIDAYRTDVLVDREMGPGTSTYVLGYRIALILTGWLALRLADRLPWPTVYLIMSALMLVGVLTVFRAPEPYLKDARPGTLSDAIVKPFQDFFSRAGIGTGIAILLFIVLYKFPDSLTDTMKTSFLLKTGFTQTQIGDALGLAGLIATIVAGVFAGFVIIRLGVNKSLWIFAVFEGLSNVSYYALSLSGLNHRLMLLAVVAENFGFGLVSAGLLAYMMSLCNKRFSATQFALLSSLMGASRDIITAPSGKIAELLGWPGFFLVAMGATIPVLALLPFIAPWGNEMPRGAATIDLDPAMAGVPVAASEFSE